MKKLIEKFRAVWPNLIYLKNKEGKKLYRFLYPWYVLRAAYPIWYYFLNRDGRRRYQENPPRLDTVQQRIAAEVKKSGIAVTHLDELFPGERWLPVLQRYAEKFLDSGRRRQKGKTFLINLWPKNPPLDLANPFLQVALSDRVMGIANEYLGLYAKFNFFSLNITTPVGEGMEAISSQNWHRDPDDKKMFKIFIYVNDVDETAGPFTYLPESQYGGKWRGLFPQRIPKGAMPHGKVNRYISKDDVRVCAGRAGTIVFADTTGLHRGGYATKKERIMFTGDFWSAASLWPVRFAKSADFENQLAQLSTASRYAVAHPRYAETRGLEPSDAMM